MALETYPFFATTAKGLENILFQELISLGAHSVIESRAGVSFQGTLEMGYKVCLHSRIANRVLLPLKTFRAESFDQLYEGARLIRWDDHFSVSQTFSIDFSSSQSKLAHTHYGALRIKDAIVDQFRTQFGNRPSVRISRPDVRINAYLHGDQMQLSIDLSGESLHRRGYREKGYLAPLKENLAAAILKISNWPLSSDSGIFIDPMCGSGTLPIEAGWMAARIAPGSRRDYFGFTHWLGHVPVLWKRLLSEALELEIHDPKKLPKILGYDSSSKAIQIALNNLDQAGLRGKVHVEKQLIQNCKPSIGPGALVMNPPYGERVGEEKNLEQLYEEIGNVLKHRFKGWKCFILTGNLDLAKRIGLRPSKKYVLFNGPIECRLLSYELY